MLQGSVDAVTRYAFDPELAPLVDFLPDLGIDTAEDVAVARRTLADLIASFAGAVDTSGLTIADAVAPGVDDRVDVPVRVYRPDPAPSAQLPALLYIHGGGFVVGSIDTEHGSAVDLARTLGSVVVSVEYRLAPEHPYPAAPHDCFAALTWLHAEAANLGVDRTRIGVIGRSAGGGLAAALALMARDKGGPALCFQYLDIPELDDRLTTPSMVAFTDTPLWDRNKAIASWRHYLAATSDDVPAWAAPARAEDLSGLPPAGIATAEFDPLRDEGLAYAMALIAAGVSVELHHYRGTFHGSVVATTAQVSRRNRADELAAVRRGLGLATA